MPGAALAQNARARIVPGGRHRPERLRLRPADRDELRRMYNSSIDKESSQYKAPFNTDRQRRHDVFTYKDTAVVTPNSDTPYSMLWMDLRAEPIVISVPAVDPKRYYSVQLIDSYTYNYGYIGCRATGSDAGDYLVAGPDWNGETPAGVKKAFKLQFAALAGDLPHPALQPSRHQQCAQGPGRLQGATAIDLSQSARSAGGARDRLPQDRHGPRQEEFLSVRRVHAAVHAAGAERGRDPRRPRQDRRRGGKALQPREPQARRSAADPRRHEDGGPADRRRGQPLRQELNGWRSASPAATPPPSTATG